MTLGHRVEIHDGIAGWTYPEQLVWLAKQAQRRSRILEVGVWRGRSTDVLSRATSGVVYAIDSWAPSDPEDVTTYEDARSAMEGFLAGPGRSSNVITYAMTSREAYARTGHLTFDMVFLDGDHRYEAVREDILMWRSRLAPGGLLCGHDGEHAGVARAVAELVPEAKFHETPQPPPYDAKPSLIWYSDGTVE